MKFIRFSPTRNTRRLKFDWAAPSGTDSGVRIYNPISKTKVPLICSNNNFLSWYSCGPTVYDDTHIGHASSYVRLDILRRILQEWFSIKPVVALGVTDIDDKIIARSKSLGVDSKEIATKYELEFFRDIERLNILPSHFILRVTEHIPDIVSYIQTILRNNHAYVADGGNIYFNSLSLPNYGKVTRAPVIKTSESRPGARQNSSDFALWKPAKPGEPSWSSPWGEGRPGWHVECSTMATKIFGRTLDVHTGGLDLAFPHHENEEAQSCAFHSVPQWVNYWLHTGHLLMNGFKMSKSMKNFITITKLLETYSADHFRMLCLMTHYRTSIDFTPDVMVKAVAMLDKFNSFLSDARNYQNGSWGRGDISSSKLYEVLNDTETAVKCGLADDFNTVNFIESLEKLVKEVRIMLNEESKACTPREPTAVAVAADFVQECLQSVGLYSQKPIENEGEMNRIIDETVKFRSQVRSVAIDLPKSEQKSELLNRCDALRQNLAAVGINVKDSSKTSSSWSRDCT